MQQIACCNQADKDSLLPTGAQWQAPIVFVSGKRVYVCVLATGLYRLGAVASETYADFYVRTPPYDTTKITAMSAYKH